jgi:hypothetical protein
MMKSQIPNPKSQTNPKSQIPNSKQNRFGHWKLGHWKLFGIWNLVIGNLLALFFLIKPALAKDVVILYTGDTHAMLYTCSCPKEPDGGVARRATLVKKLEAKTRIPCCWTRAVSSPEVCWMNTRRIRRWIPSVPLSILKPWS